jgi:phage shock protein A
MSQTLGEKLQVLFSAKLHDIVNQALQRNPIQVLNEYLRQHEEAYDQLQMDLGVTGGRVKTEERHVQENKSSVEKLTAEIERILTDKDPSNDYLAENLSADLVGKEDLLENAHRTFEAAQRAHSALLTANNKLYGRIISLRNQIALLKAIQNEARRAK